MAFIRNIAGDFVEDMALVEQYKACGDIALLAKVYGQYMNLLFTVAVKYLKDNESAKDAVMDLFEELPAKVMKHEIANFRSWLYTVMKNHCLMKLRGGKNKSVSFDENIVQLSEEMHQHEEEHNEWQLQQMNGCIETLADEQKITIQLFYLQQKCYKEIAELTGLDWNKVRSLIQNGRRNLKICMEKKLYTDRNK